MRTAIATLKSVSPYSQSRHHGIPREPKESPDDHEHRTWRDRLHFTAEDERVFMPPMGFKNCIAEAAKFLGEKIPGKRNSTWTKHFEAGILVVDPLMLDVHKKDVPGEWLFVPSDGKRGGGSRVMKCFPVIREWGGDVTFHILDETITRDAFEHHLREAGNFIGLGRFRPRNNGFYGRFSVEKIRWL